MTKHDPLSGEDTPRHLVAQAQRQLAAYGEDLDAAIGDIRAGRFENARDLAALVASLRKALEAVFSERAKLEKLGTDNGPAGTGLDLAAAGDEVRRRMARLRAAHDPRGVSGGSE